MTAVERVLEIAKKEVGVTELPAGSNKVKYNTWFYGREVSGASYPWCCAFVCWVFYMAGCLSLLRKTGGCTTLMNWFKAKGQLIPAKEAKPGDIVFFQFDKDAYADHVGIVEKRTSTGVVTIEGNTSVTSNDNGGAVMRRSRRWSVIMAVARPAYDTIKEENEMSEKEINELVDKRVEEAVAAAIEPLNKAIKELTPKVFKHTGDVPEFWRKEIAALEAAGALKGDGTGAVNLTGTEAKVLAVVARLEGLVETAEQQ